MNLEKAPEVLSVLSSSWLRSPVWSEEEPEDLWLSDDVSVAAPLVSLPGVAWSSSECVSVGLPSVDDLSVDDLSVDDPSEPLLPLSLVEEGLSESASVVEDDVLSLSSLVVVVSASEELELLSECDKCEPLPTSTESEMPVVEEIKPR